MSMRSLISRAANFAAYHHDGQIRKHVGENYINHPMRVAETVEATNLDEEVVAAAWLHDVVEDCGVNNNTITELFGGRVSRLVYAMTDEPAVPGGPNRARRKEITRQRFLMLQGQDAIDAHTIKVADCLDNAPSIREYDPEFWKVFKEEVSQLAGVLCLAPPYLLDRLCDELEIKRLDHSRQTVWKLT